MAPEGQGRDWSAGGRDCGVSSTRAEYAAGVAVAENDADRLLDVASAIEVIEKNRDLIVGVKVRADTGLTSLAALTRGRDVADRTRSPMMVQIAAGPPHVEAILPHLRAGDIVTHIYHGGADSLLDGQGHVREVFREAKARGVTFDVGLDRIHTSVAVVRAALGEWTCPPRSPSLSPWECRWSAPLRRRAIRLR